MYHRRQSYDVWFMRYEVRETEFFVILGHFLLLYPTNNPKNLNFEKIKKSAWRYHNFKQVYQKS